MGSSKKHKDKGREEKKHKHRDKDRKHHKHKHRHGHGHSHSSKERDAEKKRRRRTVTEIEKSESSNRDSPELVQDEPFLENETEEINDAPPVGGGTFQESLSIEETNKIRVKLGLAPLKLDDGLKEDTEETSYADRPDVHKPAENLASKKKTEKIQEKLVLIREKRRLNKKLRKVKTLAADDGSDLEDSAAWVEKSRRIQKEKEKAEKQAKILEEMDAEFGISNLLDDELMKEKSEAYTAKDIAGLRVEHDTNQFRDGSKVILTLKDAGILEDDEDVLLNYNIVDVEKANRNVELKQMRPGYQAYDDTEEDEFGVIRPKSLLSKYDEEIDGERKKSFYLAGDGSVDTGADRLNMSIRSQLIAQAVNLDARELTVASEYYTPQEMCLFKKPRKKKRRLKTKNVVDELVAMQSHLLQMKRDHGSRVKKYGEKLSEVEEGEINEEESKTAEVPAGEFDSLQVMDMDIDMPNADEAVTASVKVPHNIEDDWGPPIEDEAEKELQKMLNKARRLKQKKLQKLRKVEEQVATVLTNMAGEAGLNDEIRADNTASSIVLHSTSEFCRALGDIPTYGTAGNRDDDEEEKLELENEEVDMKEENEEEIKGWNQVNPDEEDENKEEDIGPVLEEEPDIRPGCVGALTLAVKKGYLEFETAKNFGTSNKNKYMEAQNFIVEDKNYNDIDSKYNKHERYRGPMMDFKDKDGYKPEFKLNYVDEAGRALNQKEAFRHLSHRFHGKGSGKLKTEKRLKKVLEEEAMKKMSSTDTPLHTVARMQEKQREMQTPYIVLSGGGKNLTTNPITK